MRKDIVETIHFRASAIDLLIPRALLTKNLSVSPMWLPGCDLWSTEPSERLQCTPEFQGLSLSTCQAWELHIWRSFMKLRNTFTNKNYYPGNYIKGLLWNYSFWTCFPPFRYRILPYVLCSRRNSRDPSWTKWQNGCSDAYIRDCLCCGDRLPCR